MAQVLFQQLAGGSLHKMPSDDETVAGTLVGRIDKGVVNRTTSREQVSSEPGIRNISVSVSSQIASWHEHVYATPPRTPTPHRISDILGWSSSGVGSPSVTTGRSASQGKLLVPTPRRFSAGSPQLLRPPMSVYSPLPAHSPASVHTVLTSPPCTPSPASPMMSPALGTNYCGSISGGSGGSQSSAASGYQTMPSGSEDCDERPLNLSTSSRTRARSRSPTGLISPAPMPLLYGSNRNSSSSSANDGTTTTVYRGSSDATRSAETFLLGAGHPSHQSSYAHNGQMDMISATIAEIASNKRPAKDSTSINVSTTVTSGGGAVSGGNVTKPNTSSSKRKRPEPSATPKDSSPSSSTSSLGASLKLQPLTPTESRAPSAPLSDTADDADAAAAAERKKKKARTTFTGRQIFELEKQFEIKKYLNSTERSDMAKLLNVTETQ
ncbi:hypothetical protein QAD02_010037, partial [Eretmocerus hayati]